MIAGVGIDIVGIDRIDKLIREHGERFLSRVFTEEEKAYCSSRPLPAQHFAGRFAAKEAVLKALGTGWAEGVGWKQVEVALTKKGKPEIRLEGRARELARAMGVSGVHVSISHADGYAVAQALLDSAVAGRGGPG